MASETEIVNMALGRLAKGRVNNLESDTTDQAIRAREIYAQTRDSLLRSFGWNFAVAHATLSEETWPKEWHHYILPADCLRVIGIRGYGNAKYVIRGQRLITRCDHVTIEYVKRETDPTKFDALFIKALSLSLAVSLCMSLTRDKALHGVLFQELTMALAEARAVNADESDDSPRHPTWIEGRFFNVASGIR